MLAPRLLIFIAILMGMSLVAGGLQVRETPVPRASSTPDPDAPPALQEERVSADERGQRIEAAVGTRLHLEVTSRRLGAVQVGEGGPIDAVAPGAPARFDLLPATGGVQEVVLLEPRRVVARITFRD